jgi:predicted HicB family RNase H-like nuclease
MLTYKGYVGFVEFDDEAEIFHGEVLNTRDVITFQGKSIDDIKKSFHESVDVYLKYCKKKGREPNKPFSGKFVVRLSPQEHLDIYLAAKRSGLSLNRWAVNVLEQAAHRDR